MPGQIIWYGKRWTLNDLTRIYWKLLSNCYPILGQICATTDRDGERNPDDKANAVDSTPGKTRIQMIYRISSKCLSRLFFFYICATIILKIAFIKIWFADLGILLDATDNEYQIKCCGFVDAWEFYAKSNTGTVDLQVWRPLGGGSYQLVGQNSYTVTS